VLWIKTRSIPPFSTVKQRFHWDANEVVASLSVMNDGLQANH